MMFPNSNLYRTITDEQVCKATGKTWSEWVVLLNAWDARQKRLVSITDHLMEHYRLSQIWAQVIAVAYHWERATDTL